MVKNLHLVHMAALAPSSRAQSCPGPFISHTEWLWPLPPAHRAALPLPLAQRAALAPSSRTQSCPDPFISRTDWLWPFNFGYKAALAPSSRVELPWPLHHPHRAALAPSSCIQSGSGHFLPRTELPWPLPLTRNVRYLRNVLIFYP